MKSRRNKWFIGGFLVLFLLLVMPMIIASIVLTPARLSGIVTEYSEKYVDGKVEFSNIKFNVFSYFPYSAISIEDGKVISFVGDSITAGSDTLLQFKQLNVAVNPIALIGSAMSIRYIGIKGLKLNSVVAQNGKANWDIIKPDTSSHDEKPSGSIGIELNELDFSDGFDVNHRDYKNEDFYHLFFNELVFKGNLTDNLKRFKIKEFTIDGIEAKGDNKIKKFSFSSLIEKIAIERSESRNFKIDIKSVSTVKQDSIELCKDLPVELIGGLRFDSLSKGHISLDSIALKVADIVTYFDGGVVLAKDSIFSDVVCTINPLKIAGIIDLIPEELVPFAKSITTNIGVDLKTSIKGSYIVSANKLPNINLDLKIDKGFLFCNQTRARLDTVKCDITLSYLPDRSNVACNIRDMRIKGSGVDIDVKASISDLLTDPHVKGDVIFKLDVKRLVDSLSIRKGLTAKGSLSLDLNVVTRQSWLNIKNIGRSTIVGHMLFKDFKCVSPSDSLIFIANGGVDFGSTLNKKDSLLGINNRIVGVSVLLDTINMNYKGRDLIAVSNMKMSVRSSSDILKGDSTKTTPMDGVITSDLITVSGADSTTLLFHKLDGNFMVVPSEKHVAAPHISTDFKSKTIYMRGPVNRFVVYDAEVNLNSTLLTKYNIVASRNELMLDSLQKVYPGVKRDSLYGHLRSIRKSTKDDFKDQDIDLKVDGSLEDLFVKWGTTGWLTAKTARVITPYLPLKNSVDNVDIRFTQNEVDVKNTTFVIGDSRINLTAKISNIVRALTRNSKLNITSTVTADSLDLNQLNKAVANGMKFTKRSSEFKDSIANVTDNEMMEHMISQSSSNDNNSGENLLFIVPSNIDLSLHLDVDNCRYQTFIIESMKGDIISKDRCLQIKNFNAETNAGVIDLSAIYSTKGKNDLRTGFDLELKNIEVGKLIHLIPEIDSLLPMLRSFDGVVDCKMAATASLDTAMNIILPSLNAACVISGDHMVLLDGETFTEIAKTLRFKNKKRNVIEKISVEMLVKDNKIEIFPFLVEMDRYQTAISGVHNLDLTYQYHISVIHSPLPFRIGINIKGNADDFSFKLGRARFKSANLPSYVSMIDTTRVNLRAKIINIFKDGVSNDITIEDMKMPPVVNSMAIIMPEEPMTQADSMAIEHFEKMEEPEMQADSLVVDSFEKLDKEEVIQ